MFSALKNLSLHRQVFALAFPMVLSNITIPLLGLVDAAVIGHLNQAWYLGGVAVGSTMITVMLFMLGFLRMATTGIAAQAWGADDRVQLAQIFLQGAGLALVLSVGVIALHPLISHTALLMTDASDDVKHFADQYFSIRVLGTPAALINMVIMGWLLGTQNAKRPMILLITINLINIVLDLLFVVEFDWKVEGAAYASVIADYSGAGLGLYFVHQVWRQKKLTIPFTQYRRILSGFGRLLRLNRDIFLRSLCLQLVFGFMTFQSAALGDDIVAGNAILMNFLMLVSFAMDGFAYAMEAMIGKAVGEKSKDTLIASLTVTTCWSLVITLLITLTFYFFGDAIINAMSSIESVRNQAYIFLPWLVVMPLISMWCFLLDGLFVGATQASDMRNTMFLALIGFFSIWWLSQGLGNHALWAAMLGFMALRGVLLGAIFIRKWQTQRFLVEA